MPFSVHDLRTALKGLDSLRYGVGDLQEAMRRIVSTTHDLFSVDGAALMLIDGELALRNAATSDSRMDLLESLQIEHGSGPCITAFQEKELVSCDDLVDEDRWGDFATKAVDAGLRAVLVSPIPYASDAIGVVAVFSAKPHAWTAEGELALMSFTDLAALAIATTLQSEERGELAAQLQKALDARVVVEQAKGVLIGREGLTPREAFEKLRAQARASRRRLSEIATDMVKDAAGGAAPAGGDTPASAGTGGPAEV
jgi:GAF domain-containing protein